MKINYEINYYETRKKIDNYLRDHYSSHYLITQIDTDYNHPILKYEIYDIENDEKLLVSFKNTGDFVSAKKLKK